MNDLVIRLRESRYNVFEDIMLECADRCPDRDSAEIFRLLSKKFPEEVSSQPNLELGEHDNYDDGWDDGREEGRKDGFLNAQELAVKIVWREMEAYLGDGEKLAVLSKLHESIEALTP